MNSPLIQIVLADDHPIVRQGLRQMIEADEQLAVVAEAGEGKTALTLIQQHRPQVAVLDIDMPGLDGFAVVRALQSAGLATAVVFLTMHSEQELFQAALDLGIRGYVLKESAVIDITAAIKSVAAGQAYLSPALSGHLLPRPEDRPGTLPAHPALNELTPTERRVLLLIAADQSSKEIAQQLGVSPRTVETHRQNISAKLNVRGSLALVRFALQHKAQLEGSVLRSPT